MTFGQNNRRKRIVIGGTYCVGKTETTKLLAKLTGIRPTLARQAREIIAEIYPGQKLETLPPAGVHRLILERFADRKANEALVAPYGFISDGSALHEWAYGTARAVHGANGPDSRIIDPVFNGGLEVLGDVVKRHALEMYTHIVHLPIEFGIVDDEHRPVSEDFRAYADQLILETWRELGYDPLIIGGTMEERVTAICEGLELEISPTANGPKEKDGGLWYAQVEDLLGPRSDRYFASRFRNSDAFLTDVLVREDGKIATATAEVDYLGGWSKKCGTECSRHLSSNDALMLLGQMGQILMYTMDGITREESNNMWLGKETIATRKPICASEGFTVRAEVTRDFYMDKEEEGVWHYAFMKANFENGSFLVPEYQVGYKLPDRVAPIQRQKLQSS
jgi:hypothetical protein